MEKVSSRVIELIAQAIEKTTGDISLDSTFDDLGIDSLAAINIAFDVESEFDIEIPDEEIHKLKCVQDVVTGVEKLLAGRH